MSSNSSHSSSLSEPHSFASLLESASAIAAMEADRTDNDPPKTCSKPDHYQTPKLINLATHNNNISDVAVSDIKITSVVDRTIRNLPSENEPLQSSAPNVNPQNPHHQASPPVSEHSQDTDIESESKTCHNCSTSTSVFWRRDEDGFYNCNACQLYFRYKGVKRPERLFKNKIKLRGKQAKRGKKTSRATSGVHAASPPPPTITSASSSVMAMSNLVEAVALDAQSGSDVSRILFSGARHLRNSSASSATSNSYTLVPALSQQRRHSLDTQHEATSHGPVLDATPGPHRHHHRYSSPHSGFFGESLLLGGGHDRSRSSGGGHLVYHPYHYQKQKHQRSLLQHQDRQNHLTKYQFHDSSYRPTSALSAAASSTSTTNSNSNSHRKSSRSPPGQRLPPISAFLKSIKVAVEMPTTSMTKAFSPQ